MDAKDIRNLQEAYMEVVMNEGFKKLPRYRMELKRKDIYNEFMDAESDSPEETKLLKRDRKIGDVLTGPTPKPKLKQEQVDLYDIILSHLLDEGYAETPEQAEVIMVNMSEEWRESICEAMVDSGLKGQEKKKIRNERVFRTNTLSKSKSTKERHKKHREMRGMKKIKGDKTGEKESSILPQSSRVHKSYNSGYNRDGSYIG